MPKTIKITANFKAPKKRKYNSTALSEGMQIEAEHTGSKKAQKIIAQNHLDEDKNYYRKLKKTEKRRK
jgi:hypothetical protein